MSCFAAVHPVLVITLGALLILLLEVFLNRERRDYLGFIAIALLIGTGVLVIRSWGQDLSYFDGFLTLDDFGLFFILIMLVTTALVILIAMRWITLHDTNSGEFYALLLFALSGMIIMVTSRNLLVIFLGLEVLSMSSYALAGLQAGSLRSSEAAVKYFLLGSFASAFLVFGIALLYGASQATGLEDILVFFRTQGSFSPLAMAGLGLLIVGFGFKIAVVPFHMWTPDVYQGAPTPVTAFFSIGPKAVGFAVLLRILAPFWKDAFNPGIISQVIAVLAVLTMVIANLSALRQTNLKRLLAYSSIAHAGYLMLAVLTGDASGLLFYLTVYLFMNVGAFASLSFLGRHGQEYLELEDISGIGFRYPWIGAGFAIFLFSLAGLPPTGGFLAKFTIFAEAVRQGHLGLVIVAVLASLISVYYYLRVVVHMYMRPPAGEMLIESYNPALFLAFFLCIYGVLQLGIFPGNVLIFARQAAASLALF